MICSLLPGRVLAVEEDASVHTHEPQLVDGYYEIHTADQLYWFADQVNGGSTSINGKLMADIVVNENVLNGEGTEFRAWTPIGNMDHLYAGTFDGNGKSVSGLYLNDTAMSYVGLFGNVDFSGSVMNVGIVGSCLQGGDFVGGVAGCNRGTVINCYNTGNVTGGENVGGVVGYNYGTVSNCYNTGIVSGNTNIGGMAGFVYTHSCTDDDLCECIFSASGKVENGYYLADCVAGGNEYGTAMTGEQFASGEVAYLLGDAFGQTIETEPYPVLGGEKVYLVNGGYTNTKPCEHNWVAATCTEPKTCSICGKTEGFAMGHSWAEATCAAPSTCTVCGETSGEALGHSWAEATCAAPSTCTVCGETSGEALGHSWAEATCTAPSTCTVCGETSGEALGHSWAEATCTAPSTCTICGETSGDAWGHAWIEATCTMPKSCDACGETIGEPLGHQWVDAICIAPKTCTACGETEGEALGHQWVEATCTTPKTCTVCGETSGSALMHEWVDATCIAPKTCIICGETSGTVLPHSWEEATCTTPRICSGCGVTSGTTLAHSYINGFCSGCDGYELAVLNGDYYEIRNAGQLYWFAEQVNSGKTSIGGKLMADIVVNENVLTADGSLNGDASTFRVWTPIGNYYHHYTGTFEGNGKIISGLFNQNKTDYLGLFGYMGSGTVQNVGLVDTYFYGKSYVAGIVGCNEGKVDNCHNAGSINATGDRVGGIVGRNTEYANVNNCCNTGRVHGAQWVGGVVGYNLNYGTVSYCDNSGNVSGDGQQVGGVVGTNNGTVKYCSNSGSISGNYVGGVVGVNGSRGTVRNSYNTGSVNGGDYAGGVAGINQWGTFGNCYNTGTVTGGNYIGSLSGWNFGTIGNSYYLRGCVVDGNNDGTAMTLEQFASGEVGYLLGAAFGQTIGTDKTPVLSGAKIYKNQVGGCNEASYVYAYSNTWALEIETHAWVDATCTSAKFCTSCGTIGDFALGHDYVNYICTRCGDDITPPGCILSGTITSFLTDGDVTVELIRGGEVMHSVVVSGCTVDYVIERIEAGAYTLRISKENHASREYSVTFGSENVTLDGKICPIGDVTGDGIVNVKDFQRMLRHVNEASLLEGYALICGDVTKDGVTTVKDFQRLLRHVNEISPLF